MFNTSPVLSRLDLHPPSMPREDVLSVEVTIHSISAVALLADGSSCAVKPDEVKPSTVCLDEILRLGDSSALLAGEVSALATDAQGPA
jgi:hypothetical protein